MIVLGILFIPVSVQRSAVPPNNLESMIIPRNEPLMQAINPKLDKFL